MVNLENKRRAISLIELTMFVAISSLVIGTGIKSYRIRSDFVFAEYNARKIDLIKEVILDFKKSHGRIPCPSDPGKDTYNEISECAGSVACSTLTNANPGLTCTGNLLVGSLPIELFDGMPPLLNDNWGYKITYAIDRRFTGVKKHATADDVKENGSLIINDVNANKVSDINDTFGGVIFVIIAHGKDHNGAWHNRSLTRRACPTTNTAIIDRDNCDYSNLNFVDTTQSNKRHLDKLYKDYIAWGTRDEE